MNIKKIEVDLLERMLRIPNYAINPCFTDLYRFANNGGEIIEFLNKNLVKIRANHLEKYLHQDFRNVLHGLIYQVNICCYRNNISRVMILKHNGIDVYNTGRSETKIKIIECCLNALQNVDTYFELNNSIVVNTCPSHRAKKKTNKI